MARPRVIIASPDSAVTVRLIASLNPKRYRIEHLHDVSEALLRAEFVLAHAVVLHASELTDTLRKRLESARTHAVGLVLVTDSEDVASAAVDLDAHLLRTTFTVPDVKRRVLDAVSDAHLERSGDNTVASRRLSRPGLSRVLLMLAERDATEVVSALFQSQLGVICSSASSPDEAKRALADGIDCVVARPGALLSTRDGADFARKLARRGIPLVPVPSSENLDAAGAGQVTWDLIPQVRRALAARERGSASPA
ncbi:MAG: hypothetical protein EBU70_12645 [Actinobacteria bacterium]|nr:hypothetical protein [Actinomycetota bacterium]